jgi:predicted RNA-binding protein YlxR (DUF448 family)
VVAKSNEICKAVGEKDGLDYFEKAKKDLSKLVKKIVVDKNGRRRGVWVKINKEEGKETEGKEKGFKKLVFNSHENHNPDCDILEGHINKDSLITYGVYVKGNKKGEEFMEYYSGNNYLSDSNKKSSSRKYDSKEIPSKYEDLWKKLKKEYINNYKDKKETEGKEKEIEKSLDNDIEKSSDSFNYGADKMTFKKTGKEIKEKLVGVLASIIGLKDNCEARMQVILDELKEFPTRKLDEWESRDVEKEVASLKMFEWCKTYFNTNEKSCCVESSGNNVKSATTKEEADLCSEYNTLIRKVIGCIRDEKKVGLLERNLEDKKIYELTTQQISDLDF